MFLLLVVVELGFFFSLAGCGFLLERVVHVAAIDFLSRFLKDPLPYNRI